VLWRVVTSGARRGAGLRVLIQGFEEIAHRFATRRIAVEDCLKGHLLDLKAHIVVIVQVRDDVVFPRLLSIPLLLDCLLDAGVLPPVVLASVCVGWVCTLWWV
jgi:hypothetical protein